MTTVSSAEHTRRDFLYIATGAVGAVGAAAVLVPLIAQMNPDASTIAAGAPIDVDLAPIADGQIIKVFWRSKPIFIFHRTKKDITEAQAVNVASLPDPEPDSERVKKGHDQWLVLIVRAMARSTTRRAAFAKARLRKTWPSRPTNSFPTPRFRSAERNGAFKVQS